MSVDSPFVHLVWNERELSKMVEGGIPYPMGSDPGGKVGTAYGVYSEEDGINTRGRFLINPEQKIVAYEVLTPPVGRNVSEALRQIQAFQLVEKTNGCEVTPSGWTPGKKTLKPGTDLVGKVWENWSVDEAK